MDVLRELENQLQNVWQKYQKIRDENEERADRLLDEYRQLWASYKMQKILFDQNEKH